METTSRSRPRFFAFLRQKEQNETTHPHRRALLLPQEIRTLPAGTALMFRGAAMALFPQLALGTNAPGGMLPST